MTDREERVLNGLEYLATFIGFLALLVLVAVIVWAVIVLPLFLIIVVPFVVAFLAGYYSDELKSLKERWWNHEQG